MKFICAVFDRFLSTPPPNYNRILYMMFVYTSCIHIFYRYMASTIDYFCTRCGTRRLVTSWNLRQAFQKYYTWETLMYTLIIICSCEGSFSVAPGLDRSSINFLERLNWLPEFGIFALGYILYRLGIWILSIREFLPTCICKLTITMYSHWRFFNTINSVGV